VQSASPGRSGSFSSPASSSSPSPSFRIDSAKASTPKLRLASAGTKQSHGRSKTLASERAKAKRRDPHGSGETPNCAKEVGPGGTRTFQAGAGVGLAALRRRVRLHPTALGSSRRAVIELPTARVRLDRSSGERASKHRNLTEPKGRKKLFQNFFFFSLRRCSAARCFLAVSVASCRLFSRPACLHCTALAAHLPYAVASRWPFAGRGIGGTPGRGIGSGQC
jgi:hypothetical protein